MNETERLLFSKSPEYNKLKGTAYWKKLPTGENILITRDHTGLLALLKELRNPPEDVQISNQEIKNLATTVTNCKEQVINLLRHGGVFSPSLGRLYTLSLDEIANDISWLESSFARKGFSKTSYGPLSRKNPELAKLFKVVYTNSKIYVVAPNLIRRLYLLNNISPVVVSAVSGSRTDRLPHGFYDCFERFIENEIRVNGCIRHIPSKTLAGEMLVDIAMEEGLGLIR